MEYHNCNLKYKNGTRKTIKKNEMFIFGWANKKQIKCKRYGNRVKRGRSTSKNQRRIPKNSLQKMKINITMVNLRQTKSVTLLMWLWFSPYIRKNKS